MNFYIVLIISCFCFLFSCKEPTQKQKETPQLAPYFKEKSINPAYKNIFEPVKGYKNIEKRLFFHIEKPFQLVYNTYNFAKIGEDSVFEPYIIINKHPRPHGLHYLFSYVSQDSVKGAFYGFKKMRNYVCFSERWVTTSDVQAPSHLFFGKNLSKSFTENADLSVIQGQNPQIWVVRAIYHRLGPAHEDDCTFRYRYYLYNQDTLHSWNIGFLGCDFDKEILFSSTGNEIIISSKKASNSNGAYSQEYLNLKGQKLDSLPPNFLSYDNKLSIESSYNASSVRILNSKLNYRVDFTTLIWSDGYKSSVYLGGMMAKDGYFYWLNVENENVYVNRRRISY